MSVEMQGYHQVSSGSPFSNGLYASNPYRNQQYTKSPWQNFLTSLGFRTQADAWQENMNVQAAEYDAAIAQKLYDQEYNDPQSQVARMRAAGLNPDIDGGSSIDSGSAAPMGEDPSTPMQSTGDDVQIMQFANGVLGVFSTAVGIANSVQGLVRNRLQNNLLSIEGESAMSSFAEKIFPYLLPDTPESEVLDDGSENSWQYKALNAAQAFAGNLPKKMQNQFLRSVTQFWSSAPGSSDAWNNWKSRVNNRKGYFNDSSYFYDESDQVLRVISDGLQSMNEKIYKLHQTNQETGELAQTAENRNAEAYANSLDSSLQAETENAQNRLSKANAEMQGIMRSTLRDMIKGLDDASKEHGIKGGLANIAKTLLAMMELYISTQGLPSVSRSSGITPKGATSSTSISF